jgi:hypothetical protein
VGLCIFWLKGKHLREDLGRIIESDARIVEKAEVEEDGAVVR